MKKTMIAMAVAGIVAAPIASAEVSISGVVEQTFTDTDKDTNGWDTATFNMLNFKASEDLGNGMTAFAKYNFLDKTGNTGGTTKADNVVGLSGDFGTIVAGTMEDFTEGKIMSMVTMEGSTSNELDGNAVRTQGGLAYVTPTINGLHAGIAGFAGAGTADTDAFDAVDIAIFYDNGPLSVKLGQETKNDTMSGSSTGSEESHSSIAASYVLGDLKAAVVQVARDNVGGTEGNNSDDTMYKFDYTMGNNRVSVGYAVDDSVTSGSDSITTLELLHDFSARTSAYVGHVNNTVESSTITEDASTYFGLKHKF